MQSFPSRVVAILARALRARRGSTAIEYGLIAALVIVAIITAVRAVGNNVLTNFYNEVAAALT